MDRHARTGFFTLGLLIVTLVAGLLAAVPVRSQPDARCFPETGLCISGRIREYWERNGGLPVFGFPITPQREERIEGRPLQVQWFERNRLELHPENARPYDVLIGRIGADRLAQQGRDWFSFPKADPNNADAENCRFFRETGHQVCGEFLQAFRRSGLDLGQPGVTFEESLALFGLPLSEPMTEVLEGKEYQVQWFERARFELHAELRSANRILFGRLGAEFRGLEGNVGQETTAVRGTVTKRDRSALPPQAVIEVTLVDISRADAPATVIGRQQIVADGRQAPFPFTISYDPALINPAGRYAVRATITIDGILRYTSTRIYPVITGNNPNVVEIVVEPVG